MPYSDKSFFFTEKGQSFVEGSRLFTRKNFLAWMRTTNEVFYEEGASASCPITKFARKCWPWIDPKQIVSGGGRVRFLNFLVKTTERKVWVKRVQQACDAEYKLAPPYVRSLAASTLLPVVEDLFKTKKEKLHGKDA